MLPDTVRVRFPGGAFGRAGGEVARRQPGTAAGRQERDGITVTAAGESSGPRRARRAAATKHYQPAVVDESFDVRLVRGNAPSEADDHPG